ncbi:MAG: hypothetical protein HY580_02095, partial [Nitrospinae bacterium]|nr:hypothetical protein [Nitrospinota bacterium]
MWKSVFVEATALLTLIFGGYFVKTVWLTPAGSQLVQVAAINGKFPAANADRDLQTDSLSHVNPAPQELYQVAMVPPRPAETALSGEHEDSWLEPGPANANPGIAKLVKAKRKIAKSLRLNGAGEEKFVIVSVSGVTKRVPVHVCGAPMKSTHKISISGAPQPAPRSMIV